MGTLELKVPRTRDGEFAPTVFERYQRNEKALLASMLEMYVSGVSTRKVSKIVGELCGKSVSEIFLFLAYRSVLNNGPWSTNAKPFTLRYELSLSDDGCSLHKVREDHRVLSKSFAILQFE